MPRLVCLPAAVRKQLAEASICATRSPHPRSPGRSRYSCAPPKWPTYEADRGVAAVSKRYKDLYLPADFVKVSSTLGFPGQAVLWWLALQLRWVWNEGYAGLRAACQPFPHHLTGVEMSNLANMCHCAWAS